VAASAWGELDRDATPLPFAAGDSEPTFGLLFSSSGLLDRDLFSAGESLLFDLDLDLDLDLLSLEAERDLDLDLSFERDLDFERDLSFFLADPERLRLLDDFDPLLLDFDLERDLLRDLLRRLDLERESLPRRPLRDLSPEDLLLLLDRDRLLDRPWLDLFSIILILRPFSS